MSWFGDLFGGGDKNSTVTQTNDWRPAPEFPEASGARQTWYNTLNDWATKPGYGAIAPNWDEIWKNAAEKVQRYYQGGPEGPGAVGTVRANLARRGMSENPASDAAIARLSMAQGNQLGDMATQQATQEADFANKGRLDWLSSLQSLAGQKPNMLNYGSTQDTVVDNGPGPTSKFLGSGLSDMIGGESGNDWIGSLQKLLGGDFSGISDVFGGKDSGLGDTGSDWESQLVKLIPTLTSLFI